ncbi:hypothetical protein CKAH01_01948 [Colletotrichum kahawae]|uniref:Uncharacterized protein n=1 Tax=Colletotrichum kahawae TaxID=34407 RepID=A0AAE0D1D4_COLKA|nr:hypothetical protein CKAH01_01948 [Colletotrichum kahawae]
MPLTTFFAVVPSSSTACGRQRISSDMAIATARLPALLTPTRPLQSPPQRLQHGILFRWLASETLVAHAAELSCPAQSALPETPSQAGDPTMQWQRRQRPGSSRISNITFADGSTSPPFYRLGIFLSGTALRDLFQPCGSVTP